MKFMTMTCVTLCLVAGGAFAKEHDQGRTDVPGADNVGSGTVSSAQSLGGAVGERPGGKGPSADNPASDKAGR
ncbi:hypothetical protein H9Q16_01520 [Sulfitobacter sp. TSTF-M16]|uniref:Uncharacterized protein n=1 Tax=Sulfitobacter aestuariivivens TaxID=2766981 RepID=A0A927D287_9RHOB|nr:hypothetical protein [Sulfitobacter aestuariivivens]MBD3662594.1 hypothetical protein [Sulfitobacter aestuariivivens]